MNNVGATDETLFEAIQQGRFQANAIGGGILFGMIILFWIPYMGHKMMVSIFFDSTILPPKESVKR